MKQFYRNSKYNNVKTVVDGIKFDSKKEAKRYSELKLLEQAGEISGLERQVRFPLHVEGKLIGTYVSDFCYETKDGQKVVEDTKGFRTSIYNVKKKLLKALYGISITES